MGYDVSHHAVDMKLVREHLIPFIKGEADLGGLDEQACRVHLANARARQWLEALGHLDDKIGNAQVKARQSAGLKERGAPGIPGWDPFLLRWGRPFFIVAETPEEVAATYDRYLACRDFAAVDEIAREMLSRMDQQVAAALPGLEESDRKVLSEHLPLVEHLKAPKEPKVDREKLKASLASDLHMVRKAWAGRKDPAARVLDPDGRSHPARKFLGIIPGAILSFMGELLPGWQGRGTVWMSLLLDQVEDTHPTDLFDTAIHLFPDLIEEAPKEAGRFERTITENYCLGGHVVASKVASFADRFAARKERIGQVLHDGPDWSRYEQDEEGDDEEEDDEEEAEDQEDDGGDDEEGGPSMPGATFCARSQEEADMFRKLFGDDIKIEMVQRVTHTEEGVVGATSTGEGEEDEEDDLADEDLEPDDDEEGMEDLEAEDGADEDDEEEGGCCCCGDCGGDDEEGEECDGNCEECDGSCEGGDHDHGDPTEYRTILEAAYYAKSRGFALQEATDLWAG